MDHPPTQHPHMHPAYLPHPAYYSPIPHPRMLYSYIAHPYPPPPPSSSPPDSSSRKRAAPDEPQISRSKRKRSNARDAVESKSNAVRVYWGLIHVTANGSRRGYNANKRSQAAQIAAQNGMRFLGYGVKSWCLPCTAQLQAYTPGSSLNANDSRSSASDRERSK
jgi:[histone H3]-dimethyl-L-lysine9 demethylase